jgi:hypothetical protein
MPGAAQPATPTTPTALGRVLSLVYKLIDYGRLLADTVQHRAAAPGFALFARPFGTTDLAVIMARITNGLRRAAALEARLCRRAALGQDLAPAPVRMPAARGPRPAQQSAPPDPRPASNSADPRPARLPTEEAIAAELRRRPIGAVIADICRDLGIMPSHPLWRDLQDLIVRYGGNLASLVKDILDRAFRRPAASWPSAWPAVSPQSPAPSGAGPPP